MEGDVTTMGGQDRADASNLLIPGKVLLLLPRLVPLVGLNEAIVLQQIRFLTAPDRASADESGRRWVCLSYASWQERHFPFWGCDTIKRAFRTLEAEGFLFAERPQRAARDQTKAYAIDYRRLDGLERALRAAALGTTGGQAPSRGKRVATGQAGAEALPASNLLLDDHPLVIIPRLAALVGLDEAIVLQQVRYWLADARSPRVHDGRRWVRFTHQEWAAQIPRSPRTLGTIFRQLEARGLLIATTSLNTVRGDQTRWYTIDFDRLGALEEGAITGRAVAPSDGVSAPNSKSAPLETADLRRSGAAAPDGKNASLEVATLHPTNGKGAPFENANLHGGRGNSAPPCAAILPACLNDQETDHETSCKTQQHKPEHTRAEYVVVADNAGMEEKVTRQTDAVSEDMVDVLARRGITRASARELAARWPMRILPQIAIYDWLRQGDTTEPRYHPGRLRRMIEEDWAPPPGFLARAERRATRRVMDLPGEGGAPASPADPAEPGDVLARQLGVHAVDQGVWQALIGSPPGFPPFLRLALFCPPPTGTRIAAVIFLDEQACARAEALSPAVKGRLAMLIAARYRLPFVEVVFFTRAALLAQLQAGGGSGGSVHPREPGDPVAGVGIQQAAGASRGSIGGREE
jgi:hypothetical protein